MATYEAKARTNYFTVTDKAAFLEWMKTYNPSAKLIEHKGEVGFIYDGSADMCNRDLGYSEKMAIEQLQKLLPEKEAVIIKEVGYEKFSYLTAYCQIITRDAVESIDLDTFAMGKASEMLNTAFGTRMDY